MSEHDSGDFAACRGERFHRSSYRPRVDIRQVDFAFAIGGYRFLFCSDGLNSLGAIHYPQLLAVLDAEGREVLYVTAESNPLDGDAVVYLGRFTASRHDTLCESRAVAYQPFFVPVACRLAREALALPYAQFPLVELEDAGIAAIPDLMAHQFPEGMPDRGTQQLIDELAAVVAAQCRAEVGN